MRPSLLAATMTLALAAPAGAQIDDAKRLLLEGGYERSVGNPGPSGAYAFLYMNRPRVLGPGSAFRLAVAPVYADAELGMQGPDWLRSGLGFGFSGGGYAFGHSEVTRGEEKRGESFLGHGGGPSFTVYPRFGNLGPAPLNGVARISAVYTDFQRTEFTAPAFEPAPDEWTGAVRAGLRWGGQEPGLGRTPAMEVSGWWESRLRDRPASYGYAGDRSVRRETNLYWGRLLLVMPVSEHGMIFGGGASAGGGDRVGRLNAYRLGGMLTQSAEFPLIIPGYFPQEIMARKFAHAWARAGVPLDQSRRFYFNLTAAGASVTQVRGVDAGGARHAGFGASLEFAPKAAFHGELAFGWAPTALRGAHHGGHSVAVTMELDFETPEPGARGRAKTRQGGLNWLFGR